MSTKGVAGKKTRRVSAGSLWETRHEQILDAAAKLFAKHGYAETDTQLLADELGVGKGTLYRYFPSKESLFLAAADRVTRRMRHEIDASIDGIADPLDQIEIAIRAYLIFCAEHPEFIELLIQELRPVQRSKEAHLFRAPRGERRALAGLLPRFDRRWSRPKYPR